VSHLVGILNDTGDAMRKWLKELRTDERLRKGYVLILPGIEGYSLLNRRIAKGLIKAGVPFGIEIHDWTCRVLGLPMFFYNLRSRRLHEQQAKAIAKKIQDYQRTYPNRPVYLIGHSGGGGMCVLTLECLPEETSISGVVLLGAALSPGYSLRPALRHVDRKVWNFSSWGDCFFLGVFTAVFGTVDGRHSPCGGMVGFRCRQLEPEEREKYEELPFHPSYLRDINLAGHFGFTSPRFVCHRVAPLLLSSPTSAEALTDEMCARLSNVPAS